jgi:hypothetical protein
MSASSPNPQTTSTTKRGKKRIQFNASLKIDSTDFYQRVVDRNKGTVEQSESNHPLSGNSSISFTTGPYNYLAVRESTKGSETSATSSTEKQADKSAAKPKKEVYDISQLLS